MAVLVVTTVGHFARTGQVAQQAAARAMRGLPARGARDHVQVQGEQLVPRCSSRRAVAGCLAKQQQPTVSIHNCECLPGWPVAWEYLFAEVYRPEVAPRGSAGSSARKGLWWTLKKRR